MSPFQRLDLEEQTDRGRRRKVALNTENYSITSTFGVGTLESLLILASLDSLERKVDIHRTLVSYFDAINVRLSCHLSEA